MVFKKNNIYRFEKGNKIGIDTRIKKGEHLSKKTEWKKKQHPSIITEFKPQSKHPNWKGGKRNHHLARKRMEEHLKRKLKKTEKVHHIDFNETNNNIDNLHLFENQKAHMNYHWNIIMSILKEVKLSLKMYYIFKKQLINKKAQ